MTLSVVCSRNPVIRFAAFRRGAEDFFNNIGQLLTRAGRQMAPYSITSSALIKMEFGIDKPSNFAVRALTIIS
jgi:hypothetical protein